MADPSVYLEKMSAFSRMLRREGLSVGPTETADACIILSEMDLTDRFSVKNALMTVYAKSRPEQITFGRVFDGFFISGDQMRLQAREQMKREQEEAAAKAEAERQFREKGVPDNLTDEQMNTYVRMPKEMQDRLQEILNRYRQHLENTPKLYTGFIHSVFARAILEQQMKEEDAALGSAAKDPEIGLYYRSITDLRDEEIPRATALIHRLSSEINGELAAKHRAAADSGKIDFRRTIRRGLGTGGTFYRIRYRKMRRRKRRLVVLGDVSGSMIQFSEFALRLIRELSQVSESSRIFLFSEEMAEADAFALQNMDHFRDTVRHSGIYGRGTDLGSALESLASMRPPVFGASATLLILSDAKTVDQPRAVRTLLAAKKLCGQVLWLNPIPSSKWKYIGSIRTFAPLVPMLPCSSLKELADAVRHLTAS